MDAKGGKYLSFLLGNEEYGVPIQFVREIIGIMEITSIPRTPKFVRGVINLRGKIIPVVDLRLKFNLEEREYNQRTCIIVVEVDFKDTKRLMGMIVDTVSEVVNITAGEIDPPPQYSERLNESFLTGMGKVKGKVILLLEMNQVLTSEEMVLLGQTK
ncbi:MAG: chemotaxis protein CheW [Clostridia bacterium]|nr:chemotaxis protein CheW [Clostridia bacterium]